VAVLLLLSGSPPARAVFYGSLVALSSTAVVTRLYSDAAEVDTPHGRLVIAVLLFQDLCVLPLMLLMPLFAGGTGVDLMSRGIEVAVGFVSLAALVAGGVVVIPWVLDRIVLLRDRELFTLCIAFFALGIALATSALFLISYLVYHFNVGSRPFPGQGPLRVVYFGILITHVALAAAILPLALTTAARGLAAQYDRHVRIARWTLPFWLYVSITGVVIYLMLYQLY